MTTYFSDCTNYYEAPSRGYLYPYEACQNQNCNMYTAAEFEDNGLIKAGSCFDNIATTPPSSESSDVSENFQMFDKQNKNLMYIVLVLLILVVLAIGGFYLYKKKK